MRNINFECKVFFNVDKSDQYELKNFTFENLIIKAEKGPFDKTMIDNFVLKNVIVNE